MLQHTCGHEDKTEIVLESTNKDGIRKIEFFHNISYHSKTIQSFQLIYLCFLFLRNWKNIYRAFVYKIHSVVYITIMNNYISSKECNGLYSRNELTQKIFVASFKDKILKKNERNYKMNTRCNYNMFIKKLNIVNVYLDRAAI